jgi:NADP-reducing hydrogenase subunit HndD
VLVSELPCLPRRNPDRRGGKLFASCVYPVSDVPAEKGFEIFISSPMAVQARKASVELLLSNHSKDCQTCVKNGQCELLHVANVTGAESGKYMGEITPTTVDMVAPGIVRDTSKCILCGRCIEKCKSAQGIGILGFEKRGFQTIVGPANNRSFAEVPCLQCGQCIEVCPTGAFAEHREINKVDEAMARQIRDRPDRSGGPGRDRRRIRQDAGRREWRRQNGRRAPSAGLQPGL